MSDLQDAKKHSFMGNVSIILISQILVKLLGMVYRMVITNIPGFGDAGNGFYTAGFQIYTLLLAISSIGIPNAISKMVSERTALKDYAGAYRIFKTAFLLFAVIGAVFSLLLFAGADFIAQYIYKIDGVQYTMRALAPSIFFVCVSSVIRGFFVGMSNMKATSTSQVLEQLFKCTLTILFVVLAIGQSPEIMAAMANLATSAACVLSFIYLCIFYNKHRAQIKKSIAETSGNPTITRTMTNMMKSILMLSIPISLGSIITSINRVIDTATITRGIEAAFAACIPAYGNNPAVYNPTAEMLNDEAVRLAGMLSKSDTLINLPLSMNIAFATVLVPSISSALALGNRKDATSKVNYSLLISILLVLPCAVGYIVLADPIFKLIYPNASLGAGLLQLSSVALIFSALNQTISGSLQGMGKVYTPATGLLFGCIAKIILNIILIRIPSINIYGAAFSTIVCQIISFSISFGVLCRNLGVRIGFVKYILKPLIAVAIMAAAVFGVYTLFMNLSGSNAVATIISIAIGAAVYFTAVLLLKIMTPAEIRMLPFGIKICSILKISE